jgi:hypothetical protein
MSTFFNPGARFRRMNLVFSLVCAVLMILAAWWKRGTPVGSPLHTALEWSIQLLLVLVIIGISVSGLVSRHLSRFGQAR